MASFIYSNWPHFFIQIYTTGPLARMIKLFIHKCMQEVRKAKTTPSKCVNESAAVYIVHARQQAKTPKFSNHFAF